MKLLSIAVPCYNSQEYMLNGIKTLLSGGEEVEIIIVDDGSTDNTLAIANKLAVRYPDIIRVVHQENGGHGHAIMTGLKNATGTYFKVMDSDDKVDGKAYRKILNTLRRFRDNSRDVDLLVSNYVYDKVGVLHKKVIHYKGTLPEKRILSWDDVGYWKKGSLILMHSVIYRTQLLRDCNLKLPKHTFYVDNLFVCIPMQYVKSLYYLNVDFYYYFIGREDQSVNEAVMIKRIDQQIKVNKLMFKQIDLHKIKSKRLRQLLYNYIEMITAVSSIMLIRSKTQEALDKKQKLWAYIRRYHRKTYVKMRLGFIGMLLHLPGKVGRNIASVIYKIINKIFGFN